jgi:hypothetical protein
VKELTTSSQNPKDAAAAIGGAKTAYSFSRSILLSLSEVLGGRLERSDRLTDSPAFREWLLSGIFESSF